jgi:hypothetical protein
MRGYGRTQKIKARRMLGFMFCREKLPLLLVPETAWWKYANTVFLPDLYNSTMVDIYASIC